MNFPDWADEQLSIDLPVLRSRGENQDLEYIEIFPENIRELAKEIAAFSTSNSGTIILGVSNIGELVGLPDAITPEGRDRLFRRIEGICAGTIKPSVTITARFAVESNVVVLVLAVPKGSQPVYYIYNTPYIRHITQSRPAEPHEVLDLIRNYIIASGGIVDEDKRSSESEFYSLLANNIIRILIYLDEIQNRDVNPWLDMWRAEFKSVAIELRELASSDIAIQNHLVDTLNILSDALEKVATFRLYLGCGPELDKLTQYVADLAQNFKKETIDKIPLSSKSLETIKDMIQQLSRKLSSLTSRAKYLIDSGRTEELQNEASRIGFQLLQISYYNLEKIGIDTDRLRSVAHNLHLVETMHIYMDGGKSIDAIFERVNKMNEALAAIAKP